MASNNSFCVTFPHHPILSFYHFMFVFYLVLFPLLNLAFTPAVLHSKILSLAIDLQSPAKFRLCLLPTTSHASMPLVCYTPVTRASIKFLNVPGSFLPHGSCFYLHIFPRHTSHHRASLQYPWMPSPVLNRSPFLFSPLL